MRIQNNLTNFDAMKAIFLNAITVTLICCSSGRLTARQISPCCSMSLERHSGNVMTVHGEVIFNSAHLVESPIRVDSNAVLPGDRIKIESIGNDGGNVIIRYLDPNPEASMQSMPSVNHSTTLQVKDGILVEADTLQPSFAGREWKWIRTVMNNDEVTVPKKQDAFVITFTEDGRFTGTTDCNNFFGQFEIEENKIMIGPVGSTRMYCEDSQEDIFLQFINEVDQYYISDEGLLIFQLKFDSGSMIFE